MWLTLLAWLKKSKHWAWIVVGVVASILLLVLRAMFTTPKPRTQPAPVLPGQKPSVLPPPPPVIQQQVDQAEEQALVATVQAQATSDAQKQQLAQVLQVDDGAERRKQLAALLQGL